MSCTYKELDSDGWYQKWLTECGITVKMEAPDDVGMPVYPLPTESGKFCPHCGKKIELERRKY